MYDFCLSPIYAVSWGTYNGVNAYQYTAEYPLPAPPSPAGPTLLPETPPLQALLALGGLIGYVTKGSTASLGACYTMTA